MQVNATQVDTLTEKEMYHYSSPRTLTMTTCLPLQDLAYDFLTKSLSDTLKVGS